MGRLPPLLALAALAAPWPGAAAMRAGEEMLEGNGIHANLRCVQAGNLCVAAPPVKAIVFDLDMTLSIQTFMSDSGYYDSEEDRLFYVRSSFEQPWVGAHADTKLGTGRLDRLREMLREINDTMSPRPAVAVLTRNNHPKGALAVLKLLEAASLVQYFDAIWVMPLPAGRLFGGAHRRPNQEWAMFEPAFHRIPHEKPDVLDAVSKTPSEWFPQFHAQQAGVPFALESIVLVDDDPLNFESSSKDIKRLPRYCEVALYPVLMTTVHRDGSRSERVEKMGGIGAQTDLDYDELLRFVRAKPQKPSPFCNRKGSYLGAYQLGKYSDFGSTRDITSTLGGNQVAKPRSSRNILMTSLFKKRGITENAGHFVASPQARAE